MERFASTGIVLALTACVQGNGDAPESWVGSIETLQSGGIRVSNPATPLWDSTTAWRLEEVWRIGRVEGAGPDVFGSITDLEVDEEGRVFVLDAHANEIQVFDAAGSFLTRFGRRGAGPGEFRNPAGLTRTPGANIMVVDYGNGRYVTFDAAGNPISVTPRRFPREHFPWRGAVDDSGNIYEWSSLRDSTVARATLVRRTGETLDTFNLPVEPVPRIEWEVPGGLTSTDVPFGARFLWWIDAYDPSFWFARSDVYRIVRVNLDGDTLLVVEKKFEPIAVTNAERDSVLKNLGRYVRDQGGSLNPSDIPETKAILSSFQVDPLGNLWVRITRANLAADVFNPQGRYLGHLTLPVALSEFPPPQIEADAVYGVAQNELGVPFVVKLAIVRPATGDQR